MRVILATLLLLGLCGTAGAGDEKGTICFYVLCDTNMIEAQDGTRVRITATKGSKTFDESHVFPKGSRDSTAVGHFASALADAGWTEGSDYVVAGNCIKFKDPDVVDGGTQDRSQYWVSYATTEGVKVGDAPVTGGEVKVKRKAPSAGRFSIAAHGVVFSGPGDSEGALVSGTAYVEVGLNDSGDVILERVADRLTDYGWQASYDQQNETLRIQQLPDGTDITTLSLAWLDDYQLDNAGKAGDETIPVAAEEALHWTLSIGD